MLLNLVENSSLMVLMGTYLNHLLEESRIGGGECLKGMHKGAKLQSQYGNGRLGCSRHNWWNRRSRRRSSRSSLGCGYWWCSLCRELTMLWLWRHWLCYDGRGSRMCRIACQLISFIESELLSTKAAALEPRLSRKAHVLQDMA